MKISIIIPTFKPQYYIYECLKSILEQSIDKNDFEVILILNGPDEGYYENLKDFLCNESIKLNSKIIRTKEIGVSNARNLGIDEAQGEFLCFIDDDDLISPNYLENLLKISNNQSVGISNFVGFTDDIANIDNNFFLFKGRDNIAAQSNVKFYQVRKYLSVVYGKLLHRQIIEERRFNCRFTNGEDSLFITSLTDKFSNVKFTRDDVIYYVRLRQGSASRKKMSVKKIVYDTLQLYTAYVKTYSMNPKKYSLLLFSYRFLGVLKNSYLLMKN